MAKQGNKITKGRPPRYVLDKKGNEVVGLSYNPTNRMYYATGTSPRYYFKIGNIKREITRTSRYRVDIESIKLKEEERRDEAIRCFYEWKKSQTTNAQEPEELTLLDGAYVRARRMLEEGLLDDMIEERARKLIQEDEYVKEDLLQRAYDILMGKSEKFNVFENSARHSELEKKLFENIHSLALTLLKSWLKNGDYDKDVFNRVNDVLEKNPYLVGKWLQMPHIALHKWLKKALPAIPISWPGFWMIFETYKEPDQYLFDKSLYETVFEKMHLAIRVKSDKITLDVLIDAFYRNLTLEDYFGPSDNPDMILWEGKAITFREFCILLYGIPRKSNRFPPEEYLKELLKNYNNIAEKNRVEILQDAFQTIEKAGYPQASRILEYLPELPKR